MCIRDSFAVDGAVDEAPASSTFPSVLVLGGGCVVALAAFIIFASARRGGEL